MYFKVTSSLLAMVAFLLATVLGGQPASADSLKVPKNGRPYADPSTHAHVIGKVEKGMVVEGYARTIMDPGGCWYFVGLPNGKSGHVECSLVEEIAANPTSSPTSKAQQNTEKPIPDEDGTAKKTADSDNAWWQEYVGKAAIYPTKEGLSGFETSSLYLTDGTKIPLVGSGLIKIGDQQLIFTTYDWPENHPDKIKLPAVSSLLPVHVMDGLPEVGGFLLHSDVKVMQAELIKDDKGQLTGSKVTVVGKAADGMAPLSNTSSSIVGVGGTRMDISPLKRSNGSLYFAGRTWVPVKDQHSYVICTPKGVIGINVKVLP